MSKYPYRRDSQRCVLIDLLLNVRVDASSWKHNAVANAIAITPQSVPLNCCGTVGMVTSMLSLSSTKCKAAICSCVEIDMPQ